jgi:hypothetical protein
MLYPNMFHLAFELLDKTEAKQEIAAQVLTFWISNDQILRPYRSNDTTRCQSIALFTIFQSIQQIPRDIHEPSRIVTDIQSID